ncbi:(p)ppGpp synthetase [Spirochaetia bacterium]|nr:(p)ppGpp synthetase [Spirochaetia bacterium]
MDLSQYPSQSVIKAFYEQYRTVRAAVTRDLESAIDEILRRLPSNPTVKGRVKNFDSYYKKYLKLLEKSGGQQPLITDIIGIRVICPFNEDLDSVERLIKRYFEVTETEKKGSRYSFKEFGYESTHLLFKIPETVLDKNGDCGIDVAEIQIRTILQDAWAEVEHEIVYKADFTPFDEPLKRKLAAVNANLSLADIIFQEIREYQRKFTGEQGKRRDSFFNKIEDEIDSFLYEEQPPEIQAEAFAPSAVNTGSGSHKSETIDDLLLNALSAHNNNMFPEAIGYYTRILGMEMDNPIRSLIFKHRGMAFFAQSQYEKAIDDFSKSLEFDDTSYKAAYYRGIVHSVQLHFTKAIDDYSLSLKIHPYQAFCLFRRGQAYYHLDDYPQALADCEAAIMLDGSCEPAKKFHALLLSKMKF